MSTYERGAQDLAQHRETYQRVLNITVWSSGLIGVSVLFFSMLFGGHVPWLSALIISLVAVLLAGALLKRGGAWYATMIGLGFVTLIMGWAIGFIASLG